MLIKFWLFMKHYWYIPLVLTLLLCSSVIYRSKVSFLLSMITSAREEHKKSLKKMAAAADTKVSVERNAADEYIESISSLSDEKNRKVDKVIAKIESRKEELEADIDEIAEQLRKEFNN